MEKLQYQVMEEEEAGYIQRLVDLHLQELGVPAVVLEMLMVLTLEVLELHVHLSRCAAKILEGESHADMVG